MSAERPHRDNSGVLYTNRKKTPNDNRPDRTGECTIGGKRYWVSCWIKGGFDSLSFTPADKPREQAP